MTKNKFLLILIILILAGAIVYLLWPKDQVAETTAANPNSALPTPAIIATSSTDWQPPLDNPLARLTKKSFGQYITTKTSPVQPERFTGYHTGLDFETFPTEASSTVWVKAVCAGPLKMKKWASGYGGVIVQQCAFNKQIVTVIYGHLNLASITTKVGATLKVGQNLGFLGKGYSTETDNERKHLHLGIHLGSAINITGYVAQASLLKNWLDPAAVLNLKK